MSGKVRFLLDKCLKISYNGNNKRKSNAQKSSCMRFLFREPRKVKGGREQAVNMVCKAAGVNGERSPQLSVTGE